MAPRKKPTTILRRDYAFTQTIGTAASQKADPYAVAEAGLRKRLDATQIPLENTGAGPLTADASADPPQPVLPDEVSTQPSVEPQPYDDAVLKQRQTEGQGVSPADDSAPSGTAADPVETGATVEMSISIFVPADLVERADRWASSIHQPLKVVMRHAMVQLKPNLLVELKTITAADVRQDRAEKVGYRLQSRTRFSCAEVADMQSRLDPAGFGNLNSMLNFYARGRYVVFLDRLMADAGY